MPTLSELLTAKTATTILGELLAKMAAKGFELSDWFSGSVQRTLVEIDAEALAEAFKLIPLIAAAGFLDLATGAWLDLLAKSQYNLVRNPSVYTLGTITLTCAAGFGPVTVEAGDLILATASGKQFRNTAGGTIADGGTLVLAIKAESPGTLYNVPNASITKLLTPIPGVTANNPSGWLTTSGANEESDALLRERCRARWGDLTGSTATAYEYWARTASASVTKVLILDQNPRGEGTVDVVIWGEGGLGGDVVTTVDDYVQAKRPLCSNVEVYAADELVVTVTATIKVKAASRAAAEATALANLAQLQVDTAIGGTLRDEFILTAITSPAGVTEVTMTNPVGDTALDETEAVTITPNLTWVEV